MKVCSTPAQQDIMVAIRELGRGEWVTSDRIARHLQKDQAIIRAQLSNLYRSGLVTKRDSGQKRQYAHPTMGNRNGKNLKEWRVLRRPSRRRLTA